MYTKYNNLSTIMCCRNLTASKILMLSFQMRVSIVDRIQKAKTSQIFQPIEKKKKTLYSPNLSLHTVQHFTPMQGKVQTGTRKRLSPYTGKYLDRYLKNIWE